jgi:hypothetical protein
VLAGAGRLNGRIQRQQVGLLGDLVDRLHDRADVARRLAQRLDHLRGLDTVPRIFCMPAMDWVTARRPPPRPGRRR